LKRPENQYYFSPEIEQQRVRYDRRYLWLLSVSRLLVWVFLVNKYLS
jgi:hypothetical protein